MKKKWYSIRDVEYSTDFQFFCDNQALLIKSGNSNTFCSRIEGRTFFFDSSINGEFSSDELIERWRKIHADILNGKHGEGELVD